VRSVTLAFFLLACDSKHGGQMTGEQIFGAICSKCHGPDGHGGVGTPPPRNFHDATFQAQRTDADLMNDIHNGRNNAMPAFGNTFTDDQVRQLVAKVRSFDPGGAGNHPAERANP
jgi:mono/diheme cytochrome c family protein